MKRRSQKPTASSSGEDSDVEKNFALLTAAKAEELQCEGVESEDEGEEPMEPFSCKEEDGDSEASEEAESEDEGEEPMESSSCKEEDGDSEASEGAESEEAGHSRDIKTSTDIKRELSHMSFEDIMKLQNRVGTKVYNQVAYGRGRNDHQGEKKNKSKRLNKNRPVEVSAKKPLPFLRRVVGVKERTFRDPRFDDLSGEFKPEIFEETYKFIDDIRQAERAVVQKKLRKLKKNSHHKEELQFLLKRMDDQERARKSREQRRERELKLKQEQRKRANQGARPFFLKKSEKKKLQLAERYEELRKSGKLDNFLSKKRKRNALKDRRRLPPAPPTAPTHTQRR